MAAYTRKSPTRRLLGHAGWYIMLTLFALIFALPFIWTTLMSIRQDSGNIFRNNRPPQLIPYPGIIGWGKGYQIAREQGSYHADDGNWTNYGPANEAALASSPLAPFTFPATTQNYYAVWNDVQIPRYFVNSLIVALCTVALNLITCSMAAYPLAKIRFKGRSLIFTLILGTLVFPPQLLMIPLYVMSVNTFQFRDTLQSLILPYATSAFGIFLLRQIYQALPDELLEAAKLDGASEFGIWWRILLPLIRPGLATLAIITFVNSWNDFLWPLLMLSNRELFTLPVGLAFLRGFFSGNIRSVAAGIMIATIPMVIFFMIFQRHFIRGLSGAVKG
jgi:putative chitobiose transport system permease protein